MRLPIRDSRIYLGFGFRVSIGLECNYSNRGVHRVGVRVRVGR